MDNQQSLFTDMDPQTQAPFFGLPRELRDMLYGLLFQGRVLKVGAPPLWTPYGTLPQLAKLPSGILVSCKLAYCESMRTYYSTASFHFYDLGDAFTWIGKSIPKPYIPLISKIIIWISEDEMDWRAAGKSEKRINKFYKKELKDMLEKDGIKLEDLEVVFYEEDEDGCCSDEDDELEDDRNAGVHEVDEEDGEGDDRADH